METLQQCKQVMCLSFTTLLLNYFKGSGGNTLELAVGRASEPSPNQLVGVLEWLSKTTQLALETMDTVRENAYIGRMRTCSKNMKNK